MTRSRRSAPTYVFFDRERGAWYLRFRYVDRAGRVHWPRKRSPYGQALKPSIPWAAAQRLELIREIEEEVGRLDVERQTTPTLGEIMDAYAADARERGTRWDGSESYRAAVIVETLGRETPITELTKGRIAAWRTALRTDRARPEKGQRNMPGNMPRPLSNRSLNAYVTLIRSALNHAVELEVITANPIAGLSRLPETQREPPALSERQIAALFEALPAWEAAQAGPRPARVPLVARVFIGYWTGARPEAIDALRWRQFDLRRAILTYASKGHRGIVVPLEPPLLRHLRALHAERQPGPEDLVLCSPDTGRPVVEWRRQWPVLLRLANARLTARDAIPEAIPIHFLRHTRISHLLLANTPPQVVAQTTGTSLVVLQKRYAHLMTRAVASELARARRHRALQAIARAASGQTGGQTRTPKKAAERGMTRNGTGHKLRVVR